jgi:hypothetical protein
MPPWACRRRRTSGDSFFSCNNCKKQHNPHNRQSRLLPTSTMTVSLLFLRHRVYRRFRYHRFEPMQQQHCTVLKMLLPVVPIRSNTPLHENSIPPFYRRRPLHLRHPLDTRRIFNQSVAVSAVAPQSQWPVPPFPFYPRHHVVHCQRWRLRRLLLEPNPRPKIATTLLVLPPAMSMLLHHEEEQQQQQHQNHRAAEAARFLYPLLLVDQRPRQWAVVRILPPYPCRRHHHCRGSSSSSSAHCIPPLPHRLATISKNPTRSCWTTCWPTIR